MGNDFSVQTLKVKSKMASSRMQTHINKKENAMVKQRRAIAQLLVDGKEQSARIKTEGILREEATCRVMEWLMMMCDLINQRVKQIQVSKECPEDLAESICTILYCAKRIDIPELTELGGQFQGKWGKKWVESNMENRSGRVSRQIIENLSLQPPTREQVLKRLADIADEHDIDWKPGQADETDMPAIVGHRDEYTVEFQSKPFGMEWTSTEDKQNLWVSNISPNSAAARAGVVPGSMLIAFNGSDIRNIGAHTIHDKAASLGLPLRITFKKPDGLEAPKSKKDMSVNPDTVNKCIVILRDPANWQLSDAQKTALCKQQKANNAEAASAIFLAKFMLEQQAQAMQQPQPQFQPQQFGQPPQPYGQPPPQQNFYPQNQPMQPYGGPSNSDFPNGMPVQQGPMPGMDGNVTYMGGNMGQEAIPSPGGPNNGFQQPPVSNHNSPPPSNDEPMQSAADSTDLDDLEARFANLRKGLNT